MTPRLSPWRFETQGPINDGWRILGLYDYPLDHNEGVRRKNIYEYNLSRIKEEQLNEMRKLGIL
jgi:hypothetical protein